MSFDTKVFAHDKAGKLVKMIASGVESYSQAIDLAKTSLGAERAMCLVSTLPKSAP
jgi:hypothetical protein